MAKSIPAIVTPEVLQWARNLDRITVEEIAQIMKVDVTKILAWESGSEYPTLLQAKYLAKQYRVSFAYFFLPDAPQKVKRIEKVDYRTLGNWGVNSTSREMRWFLRDIEERRDTMLDLYKEAEMRPRAFTLKLSLETTEEAFAAEIRNYYC